MSSFARTLAAVLLVLGLAACADPPPESPDILLVIWDTARADRMSVYGHPVPTTPNVEAWARGARVFDDCVSMSSTTVPSHASLFTGVMPSEHGASNPRPRLPATLETLAERLGARGYRTYLFSANPFVSEATGLARGFQRVEYPWDERHADEARRITQRKIEEAGGQTLVGRGRARRPGARWGLGSTGALTVPALLRWLEQDRDRPVFVVLNYMEAHQPVLPDPRFQKRAMDDETRQTWLASDRTFGRMRAFTFGVEQIPGPELDAIAASYDAALMELDGHFAELLSGLDALGRERERVLILTSDHGEHLGEHHLLDHQFSLHEPLLRVPLIVEAPGLEPGRDRAPVSLLDLHPTLLQMAGAGELPQLSGFHAAALGASDEPRARLAEYTAAPEKQIVPFARRNPSWDPEPWRRSWRSLHQDGWKIRVASDGAVFLHDLSRDPGEEVNLADTEPERRDALLAKLGETVSSLRDLASDDAEAPELPDDLRDRLESLGYAGGGS